MSQLLKLLEKRSSDNAIYDRPREVEKRNNTMFGVASEPIISEHTQSAFTRPVLRASGVEKKRAKKSRSPAAASRKNRVVDRRSRSQSSRSQSGCSVCDNEIRRSRSRSRSRSGDVAKKRSVSLKKKRKPEFFLEELLDDPNHSGLPEPHVNKVNFFEDSISRPTLFDKYLV